MSTHARIIGGFALGAAITLVAVVGLSAIREAGAKAVPALAGGAQILSGADALALGCQPHESALVHRAAIHEEPMLHVRCVMLSPAAAAPASQPWIPYPEAPASHPDATAQPVAATVAAPAAIQREEPAVIQQVQRAESRPRGRPWQKTAMVIGGSTATGAGVGGLVGGKKGALVGAAIGGGTSTIYESAKR